MLTESQLKDRIFMLEKEIKIYKTVLNGKQNSKIGRPKGSFKYSTNQYNFLKENKDILNRKLIKLFNKKFNTNFHEDSRALYNFMERSGIIIPRFRKEYKPRLPTVIDKIRERKENG